MTTMTTFDINNRLDQIELKHRIQEQQEMASYIKQVVSTVYEQEDPCEEVQYELEKLDARLTTLVSIQWHEACMLWKEAKYDLLRSLLGHMSNEFENIVVIAREIVERLSVSVVMKLDSGAKRRNLVDPDYGSE